MKTPSFVYSLTWENTNHIYVGCTQNPKSRAASHKAGKANAGVDAAIAEYGDPLFTILEVVAAGINPYPRECHWILTLKSLAKYPGGMNKNLTGLAIEVVAPPPMQTGADIAKSRETLVETEMLAPLFSEQQVPTLRTLIAARLKPEPPQLDPLQAEKLARRRRIAMELIGIPT